MSIWNRRRTGRGEVGPQPEPSIRMTSEDAVSPLQRWVGYIDRIDRKVIHGWCADRENPSASIAVEAIGSKGHGTIAIASLFRRDVLEGGYGNGRHGFELDVAGFDDDETVTIRFADSGHAITTAPIALDPFKAILSDRLPEAFEDAARRLAQRIEARHTRADAAAAVGGACDERLIATFDAAADPEGLVTRFTAHEASRVLRGAFDLARVGSIQERLEVLMWYVDSYAGDRSACVRVPLSRSQVAALVAPAPLAGASEAVTVALLNFVLVHMPSHVELRDERLLREAVYWWCTRQAVQHGLDDRLVTAAQVALLATLDHGAGTQVPCSSFMVLYAREHPHLADLDLGLSRDRLALLGYLVLASFLDPGLLRFLPREPLRRVLRGNGEELAAILGRLVSTGDETAGTGADILAKGEALLAAAGWSLQAARPRAVAATPPSSASDRGVRGVSGMRGVRVLGPMTKSSGLGRATRLSLDALAICEDEAPVAFDFGMENPAAEIGAAEGGAIERRGAAPEAGREITLLHLNAEALPLALAYGPRALLADTYRIGFFFWELTELPECHRLALDVVDEIWVASEFNREIYARATTKPVVRVGMAAAPLPDVAAAPRSDWGIEQGAFVFIAVFDSLSFIARKNPLGAIEAFSRAFPRGDEAVVLILKTHNRGIVRDDWQVRNWRAIDRRIAADPRIVLIDETLAFPELLALMRACDAYVSLHRSEGWGFGLVEAMQLGLPVVCTGWSGNADFCGEATAFLVDHRLIPVEADEYIYTPRGSLWADPSIEAAAAQLRVVAGDRAAAARKADAARSFIAEHLGLEATARRYGARLAAIRGARGAGG